MADNNDFPKTFKLAKSGDSATVRFLHTSVSTIETVFTHWVQKGETWKHFRCLGENCPACLAGNQAKERAYIRLFNYDTNEVEIWDRTANNKFLNSLVDVEKEWGGLNATAIKVTRESDDFPTYALSPCPPNKYTIPNVEVDEKIAYRMVGNRSAEDITTFLTTGVMPPKPQKNEQSHNAPTAKTTATAEVIKGGIQPNTFNPLNTSSMQYTPVAGNTIDDEDLPF